MLSRMADIVALRTERTLARWTRNAVLWRYPVCAILVEAVFFLSIYVLNHGTGGESWFALVLMLLLLQVLLAVIFLGIAGLGLLRKHFKLALAAFLGAAIIGVAPWYSARIEPALYVAIDRARFYAERGHYDAIIAKMPSEERASTVMFFDWGRADLQERTHSTGSCTTRAEKSSCPIPSGRPAGNNKSIRRTGFCSPRTAGPPRFVSTAIFIPSARIVSKAASSRQA